MPFPGHRRASPRWEPRRGRAGGLRTLALALVLALLGVGEVLWTLSGGDPEGGRALVTEVVDGDTVHVGRGWRSLTVRLIGVDAPETVHPERPVEPYGPEAAAFTRRSLQGRWVRLEFEAGERADRYGRHLAYLILEDGTLFNLELVRQGYARAYTRFPFRYREEFRRAERQAREAGRGLWARQPPASRRPSVRSQPASASK